MAIQPGNGRSSSIRKAPYDDSRGWSVAPRTQNNGEEPQRHGKQQIDKQHQVGWLISNGVDQNPSASTLPVPSHGEVIGPASWLTVDDDGAVRKRIVTP